MTNILNKRKLPTRKIKIEEPSSTLRSGPKVKGEPMLEI